MNISIVHPTERPNFASVELGALTIWFSYNTPIAFHTPATRTVVRENDWGPTTGKHLGMVERDYGLDRGQRIEGDAFEAHLSSLLVGLR